MHRGLIYLFGILLFLEISMADVLITEVMYDPECSDSYCEYIEIYNNNTQTMNITSWTIEDNGSVDVLEGNDVLLVGTIESILYRDLLTHYGIRNPAILKDLLELLCDKIPL